MQILRWAKRQADYFVAIYPVTYLDLLPSLYLEGFFLKAARVIPTDAAGWIKIRVNWNPNRLQRYSFHLRLTRKRWEFKRNGCYSIFRLKMLIMNNVTKKYLRKKCQIVTPIWGRWPHKAAESEGQYCYCWIWRCRNPSRLGIVQANFLRPFGSKRQSRADSALTAPDFLFHKSVVFYLTIFAGRHFSGTS